MFRRSSWRGGDGGGLQRCGHDQARRRLHHCRHREQRIFHRRARETAGVKDDGSDKDKDWAEDNGKDEDEGEGTGKGKGAGRFGAVLPPALFRMPLISFGFYLMGLCLTNHYKASVIGLPHLSDRKKEKNKRSENEPRDHPGFSP